MLCPACKKLETSILKTSYESFTNTVKRQRTCDCGNLFETYEIDKSGLKVKPAKILKNSIQVKKKRKPTIKEEWIDFRVFLYGFMRMKAIFSAVMNAKDKFDKKFKYGEQTLVAATKFPNKKSFFSVFNRNNNEYSDVKIEGVKQTIKKCLDLSIYWKKRKYFFKNKSIPEKNDARAFNDEAQEYFRSITSYVKNDKYNADFYSNNKYFDEMLSVVEIKEDREKLRKAYFSSQNWIWYEEVR
jgi:hypothetical protein